MSAISAGGALLERGLRAFRLTEAQNARLTAERDLQDGEITLLRKRTERLERELATEREARAILVEHVIDWLEQGEEIVRAAVTKPVREALVPGQTARAAVLADIDEALRRPRERLSTADFARAYGGTPGPAAADKQP